MKKFNGIKENVWIISKSFVQEWLPEEAGLFEPIWNVMGNMIDEWQKVEPRKWAPIASNKTMATALGFSDAGEICDLITPIIIAVVAAVLIHISKFTEKAGEEEVKQIVGTYAKKFDAPQELCRRLGKYLSPLCELHMIDLTPEEARKRKQKAEKQVKKWYRVYENGKPSFYTGEEKKLLEKRKKQFFVWVDDEKNEVIIDKQDVSMERGKEYYAVFINLLKRVGSSWDNEELYSEAIGKKKERISETRTLLRQHIEHIFRLAPEKLRDYIDPSHPGEIRIGADMKTCLTIRIS
jgi:hypothetical protein